METVYQSMNKSKIYSEQYIIPLLQSYFGDGFEVSTVEGIGETFSSLLDMKSGADLLVRSDANIWFIASRIQEDRGFRTFTVRYKRDSGAPTEYQKRLSAMEQGAIRPKWNVHSYIGQDGASVALIDSDELFEYMKQLDECGNLQKRHTGHGQIGGATLCYVTWDELVKAGKNIKIWSE